MKKVDEFTLQDDSRAGVIVPVITPIDDNDEVDELAYRAVIRRCLAAGVNGIFAGGSAGMGPLLPEAQWQRAMEIARSEVTDADDVVLMGGVIATSTSRALQQIRVLEQLGYDAMVVTPTYYITITRHQEMMSHFSACRDASTLPMVVYNIPSCTSSLIPLETVTELVQRGWTHLIKESSGDREYFMQLLDICRDQAVGVMQGNEPDIYWGLVNGAAGIVPVCANYEPETFVDAVNAAQRNDKEQLKKIQTQISFIREKLLLGDKNWIAGIMYGVHSIGIGNGKTLGPLLELSDSEKARIDSLKPEDVLTSQAVK